MDAEASANPLELERSVSHVSVRSSKSERSTAAGSSSKKRAKLTSQPSSSAASIAESDKSLTSFPSFSPDSPRDDRPITPTSPSPVATDDGARERKSSSPVESLQPPRTESRNRSPSMVQTLLTTTPPPLPSSDQSRTALFQDDTPVFQQNIPGALHLADDAHIERLITRHGAVGLVRSIAEDLATRDAQIVALRRRADERERVLRKIILECGLSNLDLETRLRAIEREARASGAARKGGVEELVEDAMSEDVTSPVAGQGEDSATVRVRIRNASNAAAAINGENKATGKGWKDYLWGTSKPSSRASSINGDAGKQTVVKKAASSDRRPTIQEDSFQPPDQGSVPSSSRTSSLHSGNANRKTSLASSVLRMVAGGGASTGRDGESRGRASSSNAGAALRTPSTSSARTDASARAVSMQAGPKGALAAMRRTATQHNIQTVSSSRSQPQARWDTMDPDPPSELAARPESYGPVEMDSILPPEDQPPTLARLYNNYNGSEYLTDRFGFIYDQRRKKRQRDAQQMAKRFKRGSRTEMLMNGRANLSPASTEDGGSIKGDVGSGDRPGTPSSMEEIRDESKPKRWQDYLKIATFPTELLSHTPSISAPTIEVMEGSEVPKSPGPSPAEDDRGFIPSASTATAALNEEPVITTEETTSGTLVKEDVEPVRILLQQLSEVHDSLQREKTVRWNEFLRKVRAERRREGEAANASAAEAAAARFQRATVMMPEARVADGEQIGVANWANKGKVGRAKWNEFSRLVLAGIPVFMRSKTWAECSGANSLRVPGYYDDLVNRPESEDNPEVAQQIRADINRTLTDNIFFRKGPGVQKLNEVLLAYSRRNTDVGYCQGMNLITANLLLIMPSAEDVFWILACIIEKILPAGYYDHSLLASRADQQVLRGYVAQVLPRLSAHFDELGIALETMTFQWFLSVFTDCLSAEALFRVWDVVFCFGDGSTFLFQVALALLKLNEQQLLGCVSPAAVYTYINHQMTNHAISIDGLIQASEGLRRVVRREDVEARREKAIEAERELVRQREERLRLYKERKAAALSAPARTDRAGEGGNGETKGLAAPAVIVEAGQGAETAPAAAPATIEEVGEGGGGVDKPPLEASESEETVTAVSPGENFIIQVSSPKDDGVD